MLCAPLFTAHKLVGLPVVSVATENSWTKHGELRAVTLKREYRLAKIVFEPVVHANSTTKAINPFHDVLANHTLRRREIIEQRSCLLFPDPRPLPAAIHR